ncbi:hypothetical protein [Acinetobacter larvae]|uniref:Uncharacterized protein n=1 Tax=Acinetobacter larvae TaxID=1789224 RepID=A0A1B2LZ90_9GAMM|nr:hypothetical protein [Acinetobacter larvae]AOA58254.1 hypothetical protein BFG52_07730 [Acinetobacter larvae]
MNMKSNISKPAVASNDTATDFVRGDAVVLINGDDNTLYEFSKVNTVLNAKCYITKPCKAKMLSVWISDIRHATTAEITARRRLDISTNGVLIA